MVAQIAFHHQIRVADYNRSRSGHKVRIIHADAESAGLAGVQLQIRVSADVNPVVADFRNLRSVADDTVVLHADVLKGNLLVSGRNIQVGGSEEAGNVLPVCCEVQAVVSGAAYLNTVINRTADRNITGTLTGNFNTTTTEAQDTQLTKETLLSGRLSVSSSFIFGNLFLSAEAGATIGFPTESKNDLKTYGKFDAALRATLNLKQIVLSLSASGQWMPFNDLVPNQELMYAGGPTSVRGYMMNCAWGKTAYRASAEDHFMIPKLPRSSIYGFLDHAGVFPYPDVEDNFLLSAGFGAELNIGNIVHLNMNVGLPFWKVYQDKDNPGYKVNLAVTVSTSNINV